MSNPTCKTCRWWDDLGTIDDCGNAFGECHARPPTVLVNGQRTTGTGSPFNVLDTVWPETAEGDFCGEHAAHPHPDIRTLDPDDIRDVPAILAHTDATNMEIMRAANTVRRGEHPE